MDTKLIMARFEQRHRTADNPHRDQLPDVEAIGAELAVVQFARRYKKALPRLARRAEAIDRLVLIEQIRLILDREELEALRDGGEAGATWRQRGDPLGITTKNGTVQRMQRLRVAVELGPAVLRLPSVLRAHERSETTDSDSRTVWVSQHYLAVRQVAADLLQHRGALATDEEAAEWLDDLADLLEEPVSPTCEASIITHVRFAVEEIHRAAREAGISPAGSVDGADALKGALQLVGRYRRRSNL